MLFFIIVPFLPSLSLSHSSQIELRPTSVSEEKITSLSTSIKNTSIWSGFEGCPVGSVPIRRTLKEDVLRAKSFSYFGKRLRRPTYHESSNPRVDRRHTYRAALYSNRGNYYGAKAFLNIWEPYVPKSYQYSMAKIAITNGRDQDPDHANVIEAGWAVFQDLFNDTRTRLYTYWTVDSYGDTGCFNILCSGFVQVKTDSPLGWALPDVSQYGGDQYELGLHIYRDPATHNWWLTVPQDQMDVPLGYWPSSILTSLASNGASELFFGGEVLIPNSDEVGPNMGSGHYPWEGFGKAANIRAIQYGQNLNDPKSLINPPDDSYILIARKDCYAVEKDTSGDPSWGVSIFYGGNFVNSICSVP